LITSMLLANAGSSRYFSTFYRRRSFRILPIYGV
jgi:peptidoglycan/LPS O-acetylase OafA/YrhL